MKNAKHTKSRESEQVQINFRQHNGGGRGFFHYCGLAISIFMLVIILASFRIPNFSEQGGEGTRGNIQLTREISRGGNQSLELAELSGGDRASAKQISAPSRAFDLDRLAIAVAQHETADCTKGVGVTHCNCHGIRQNGAFVRFDSRAASYHSFKLNWLKHYGDHFPTFADAVKYSGNDRADAWLKNVTQFYEN